MVRLQKHRFRARSRVCFLFFLRDFFFVKESEKWGLAPLTYRFETSKKGHEPPQLLVKTPWHLSEEKKKLGHTPCQLRGTCHYYQKTLSVGLSVTVLAPLSWLIPASYFPPVPITIKFGQKLNFLHLHFCHPFCHPSFKKRGPVKITVFPLVFLLPVELKI